MRTSFDFTPLYRSSVGFDRVFDILENASRVEPFDSWPPYDIVRTGEDSYRVAMAVAGFSPDELKLTYQPNLLIVSGAKAGSEKAEYLYRGIAGDTFERRFELADHVEVVQTQLENGILTIGLERKLPEAMKPRRIAIGTGAPAEPAAPRQIEQKQAA